MTPVRFIRKTVLGLTQKQLADQLGRKQPTIHRWEKEGRFPSDAQDKIRELGRGKTEQWSDAWFFEVPAEAPALSRGRGAKAA